MTKISEKSVQDTLYEIFKSAVADLHREIGEIQFSEVKIGTPFFTREYGLTVKQPSMPISGNVKVLIMK